MEPKIMATYYRRIGLIGIVLLIFGSVTGCNPTDKAPPPFGYHALKINGHYISPDIFFKEQNSFYLHYRWNAWMLRKSEEERTDLILEEIIDHTLIDDFLHHHAGITVTPREIDDYINRYIKAKMTSPADFSAYLQNSDYKSETDLKKTIELYLLKLKYFPTIAQKMGLTIPPQELDSLYQKHCNENKNPLTRHPKAEFADLTLMEKFGSSEQLKTWIATIEPAVSIEILDPAMKAYRIYRDGHYDEAGALYEKSFKNRRNEFYLQRAIESYRMAKNWKKILDLSETGMQKYPEKLAYYLNKAEGLYEMGRINEAMTMLKNAETRSQGSLFLKELVRQTYATLGLTQDEQRMKNNVR